MGRYIKGNVDEELGLGTLAGKTLVGQAMDESVPERTLVSSIVAAYSLDDFTNGFDIGPIVCGVAHGDYSDAEIEEVIENTGSWSEGDLIAQEVAKRKIRIIGTFSQQLSGGTQLLNQGRPIKTKLNWILLTGDSLRIWAYNMGSNALATTVPTIHVSGHVNLFPR